MGVCIDCATELDGSYHFHCRRCHECRRKWETVKQRAMGKVNAALIAGKLVRLACEVCGTPRAHAHHDDYSKPLEVRWLCHLHHRQFHAAMDRAALRKAGME